MTNGEVTDLIKALEQMKAALSYVIQHAPGYDWNADPLSLTLKTGEAFAAADKALAAFSS